MVGKCQQVRVFSRKANNSMLFLLACLSQLLCVSNAHTWSNVIITSSVFYCGVTIENLLFNSSLNIPTCEYAYVHAFLYTVIACRFTCCNNSVHSSVPLAWMRGEVACVLWLFVPDIKLMKIDTKWNNQTKHHWRLCMQSIIHCFHSVWKFVTANFY